MGHPGHRLIGQLAHTSRWRRGLIGALLVLVVIAGFPLDAAGADDGTEPTETDTLDETAESDTGSDEATSLPETDSTEETDTTETPSDATDNDEDEEDGGPATDGGTERIADEEADLVTDNAEDTTSSESTDDASTAPDEATDATAQDVEVAFISGEPVYEITGAWVDAPATVSRGNPVVAEWRINVNDSGEPPGNDPVDNVSAAFELANAIFDEIPDMCLVDGVDPPSSLSDDGTALTCNFGTVNLGTAIVLQTPVVPTGSTGEQVTHDGTIDGQTVDLPPIEILNPFAMDMYYGQNTDFQSWNPDATNPQSVDIDIEWTLRLGTGSDPGPDSVSYVLTVTSEDGSPVAVSANPREPAEVGCGPHWMGPAEGHPFSGREDVPGRNAPFVASCTLEQMSATQFRLTLSGIDYSLLSVPELDSAGNTLPPNWTAVAAGMLWFRVTTDNPGSISVTANSPTYTAPTGQQFQDVAGNNVTNKSYTLPGSWAAVYERGFTGSGGTWWDDSYRVPVGTTVQMRTSNRAGTGHEATDTFGSCLILDTAYATYVPGQTHLLGWNPADAETVRYVPGDPDVTFEWYTGAVFDPDSFDCGSGTWTTTEPADPTAVQAIRVTYPFSRYSETGSDRLILRARTSINADVQAGQDVWMFGSALKGDGWLGISRECSPNITPTPGARYPCTNGRRDILRVVTAVPHVEKEAAEATVTPGVPADFTLTYAATGSALLPPTIDNFQIRDVLPLGMTYVEGSAAPEPGSVTTNPDGQQVLVWSIDGVETNVEHTLTYQAFPETTLEPGTALTNVADARMGVSESQPTPGEWSDPAEATVTTTTNGYTTILKTADVDYIPNDDGDGTGTGSWTVTIDSFDPLPQSFTDTIDILPYNGDLRGTSYSGSYDVADVVTPDGGTVYYTTADISTLTYDPADSSNGSAGSIDGNTVGWSTTPVPNPTAIRVIGGELAPGDSFRFQIVIATDGASPRDVYWNSAQARAEHTELVMRTSAPLTVTDFQVVKTSDPEPGSLVDPGDTVNYTVTVTQVGDVPSGAWFTDDLSEVLDDADYNDDASATLGDVTVDGETLTWAGEIPVGGSATITYSVTLKDAETLGREGDAVLTNVVTSPGCPSAEACTTTHYAGRYEYVKNADPVTGSAVEPGDVVTYTVVIASTVGANPGATITDDLSGVLDDATWNNDVDVDVGETTLDGTSLTWVGDLDAGQSIELTYSVTVTGDGDDALDNVVSSDDPRATCDGVCATEHPIAEVSGAAGLPRTGDSQRSLADLALLLIGTGLLFLLGTTRGSGGSPQWAFGGHPRLPGEPGLRIAGAAKLLYRRVRPSGAGTQAQRGHPDRIPPTGSGFP